MIYAEHPSPWSIEEQMVGIKVLVFVRTSVNIIHTRTITTSITGTNHMDNALTH